MKISKNKVIITSIEAKDNNLIEVIDSTGRKELFPVYAWDLLLNMMQTYEDPSRMMEYANLLNKHMLKDEEDI